MVTNPIFLANSDRGRSHKPSIHSPLHLGDRELRRRGGAYTYRTIGNDVYVSITLRPSLHACNFNPIIRPGRQTSWLSWYYHTRRYRTNTSWHAATTFPVLKVCRTCKNVSANSFVPPTTGCLILDIRCAERSTHIRPATSNSKTCSRATTPIFTAAQNLKLRYFTLSLPPEKRWSLTIPKCTVAKHTVWRQRS